jgi:hypothetical protein
MSGKVKVPNVPAEFKWTGDKVKKNAGQGDIYIQSIYPLKPQQVRNQSIAEERREDEILEEREEREGGREIRDFMQYCIAKIVENVYYSPLLIS